MNKKKLLIITILILIILLGLFIYMPLNKELHYSDEELGINKNIAKTLKGYKNIAIYGIDDENRSDVMFILSLNKRTDIAKMFAVQRDTLMELDGGEKFETPEGNKAIYKCNYAYQKAGKIASIRMLNRHLDLNIREYIAFDWETIKEFVDSIDGIDVEINETLRNYINNNLACAYPIKSNNGTAHMNGKQAVAYLRTMRDPGSDATVRSERNLKVFIDMYKRAKEADTVKSFKIFKMVAGDIETNINLNTTFRLAKAIKNSSLKNIKSWPYKYNKYRTGIYEAYIPDTLKMNAQKLHRKLFPDVEYINTNSVNKLSNKLKQIENTKYR